MIQKWLLAEFGEEQGHDMVECIFRFMDDNVDGVIDKEEFWKHIKHTADS